MNSFRNSCKSRFNSGEALNPSALAAAFLNCGIGFLGLGASLRSSRTGLLCALLFREPLRDLCVPLIKFGVEGSDLAEIQCFKCRKFGSEIREE